MDGADGVLGDGLLVLMGFLAGSAAWTAVMGLWGLVGRRGRDGCLDFGRKMDCVWWVKKMDLNDTVEPF